MENTVDAMRHHNISHGQTKEKQMGNEGGCIQVSGLTRFEYIKVDWKFFLVNIKILHIWDQRNAVSFCIDPSNKPHIAFTLYLHMVKYCGLTIFSKMNVINMFLRFRFKLNFHNKTKQETTTPLPIVDKKASKKLRRLKSY